MKTSDRTAFGEMYEIKIRTMPFLRWNSGTTSSTYTLNAERIFQKNAQLQLTNSLTLIGVELRNAFRMIGHLYIEKIGISVKLKTLLLKKLYNFKARMV